MPTVPTPTTPRRTRLAIALLLFIPLGMSASVSADPNQAPGVPDGNKLVSVQFLSDTVAVEPGKPFRVGVHFTIEPKWHIYWINPGDSGFATDVRWTLPEGFTVSELHWPAPSKFPLPGGLVNYGYEGQTMLLATITPPTSWDGRTVPIAAEATWLVCDDDQCLPGSASAELVLPVGHATPSEAFDQFERWSARVPRVDPPEVHSYEGNIAPSGGSGYAVLTNVRWNAPVKQVQWFPLSVDGESYESVQVEHNDAETTILAVLVPQAGKARPEGRKSVLTYTSESGERRAVLLKFDKTGDD